jgi:cytochrome c556
MEVDISNSVKGIGKGLGKVLKGDTSYDAEKTKIKGAFQIFADRNL